MASKLLVNSAGLLAAPGSPVPSEQLITFDIAPTILGNQRVLNAAAKFDLP